MNYSIKNLPQIGDGDYWNVVHTIENSIDFSIVDLFKMLPSEIRISDGIRAYLFVQKLNDNVVQVSYKTWKNITKKDFESVSYKYWTAPTLKLALYMAYDELNKKVEK